VKLGLPSPSPTAYLCSLSSDRSLDRNAEDTFASFYYLAEGTAD